MAITKDYPNANWATATETTVEPRITYPFKGSGDESGYIVERDYVQAQADYDPMALDTLDGAGEYLIEETVPQAIDASLCSFTRKFATVPSSFTTQQFEAFTFPGKYADYAEGAGYFRPPLPKLVGIEVTHTFDQTDDPITDFAITGTPLLIYSYYGEYVDYVASYTSPTITTYNGYISGSTLIQIRENVIRRAYGKGNIWEQLRFRTVAQ